MTTVGVLSVERLALRDPQGLHYNSRWFFFNGSTNSLQRGFTRALPAKIRQNLNARFLERCVCGMLSCGDLIAASHNGHVGHACLVENVTIDWTSLAETSG